MEHRKYYLLGPSVLKEQRNFFKNKYAKATRQTDKWVIRSGMEQVMRKQLKKKRRSCALCKPHKMGWMNRWKAKDKQIIIESEKEIATTTDGKCCTTPIT